MTTTVRVDGRGGGGCCCSCCYSCCCYYFCVAVSIYVAVVVCDGASAVPVAEVVGTASVSRASFVVAPAVATRRILCKTFLN